MTLSAVEQARVVNQIAKDTEYIKTTKPSLADLVQKYSTLIPGKKVSHVVIKKVLEELQLDGFLRKVGRNPFMTTLYARQNATATVVKRVASQLGVPADELNWSTTMDYQDFVKACGIKVD